MKIFKLFIFWFGLYSVLLGVVYLGCLNFQFGSPIPAEYWLKEQISFKEHNTQKLKGKTKIVIISGSNSLFGLDSPKLADALDIPVANLSAHAGMPLDWIISIAEKNTHPGDIILMPLEWGYYYSDFESPTEWTTDQVVAWAPEYYERLDFGRKFKFMTSITPNKLFNTIKTKLSQKRILKKNPNRKVKTVEELVSDYSKRKLDNYIPDPLNYSYQYYNGNLNGDLIGACGNIPISDLLTTDYGVTEKTTLKPEIAARVISFIKSLERSGRTVLVTFPSIVSNKVTGQKWYSDNLNQIAGMLKNEGVKVLGDPKDHFFAPEYFFDSKYHLNCEGKANRTSMIAKQLQAFLANEKKI